VLHSFDNNGTDGWNVIVGLTLDAAGNLYGSTVAGGTTLHNGIVFELTPAGDGSWTETVLHTFVGTPDGEQPLAPVIFDAAGNLYGTTAYGGIYEGGTGFELTPNAEGGWTETVLYSFCSQNDCTDGSLPVGGLVLDAAGSLYGTTYLGGTYQCTLQPPGCGTVFKLSPANPCAECSNAF
jgi:uncharacterized repeat protein (TIGR03803 family)